MKLTIFSKRQKRRNNYKIQNYSIKLKIQEIYLGLVSNFSPLAKYKISGESMCPVLHEGDCVLVNKLVYLFGLPKKGDIIAAFDPRDRKIIIKRITKIENNRYFVEGDNKLASTDSRSFGLLQKENILGKVIFVL